MKYFYLLVCCSCCLFNSFAQVQDSTMWITDGYVSTSTSIGNTIYIGGDFSYVGPPTGGGATINLQDGRLVTPRFPHIDGTIFSCTSDGQGGWFIGGEFTKVQGTSVVNIAHILPENILDPNWKPTVTGVVKALLKEGNTLYLGGDFTAVNNQPRNSLAALNAANGQLAAWNPDIKGRSGIPSLNGIIYALTSYNGLVYAGGNFTEAGGAYKRSLASIRMDNGLVSTWSPNVDGGEVYSLAIRGNLLYVGGSFTSLQFQSRNRIAAVDINTGQLSTWNPIVGCTSSACDANGRGSIQSIAVSDNTVFIGGLFTSVNGQNRNSIAALDAASAQVLAWNPVWNTNNTNYIKSLAVLNNTLYAAGTTDGLVLGAERMAAFDVLSGEVSAWKPACFGTIRTVYCLAVSASSNSIYVGGSFSSVGGIKRWSLAALDGTTGQATDWNPNNGNYSRSISALLADQDKVYIGGSFYSIGNYGVRNLAAVDAATGQVLDWKPNPDAVVYTLTKAGNFIIIGGSFTSIDGNNRNRLASIQADTRQLTSWNPDVNGIVTRSAASADQVYIGGTFTSVGAVNRNKLASVDLFSGKVSGWNPSPNNNISSITVGGDKVYVGGNFTQIAGTSRNRIAAFSTLTGHLDNWNPGTNNNVICMAISGKWLYAGGAFTTVGGQPRNLVAKIDASSGQVDGWSYPLDGGGYYVRTLLALDKAVYMGGLFDTFQRRVIRYPYFSSLHTVSSVPNTITGTVYLDSNENCRKDSGEESIQRTIVMAQPGPYFGITDENGNYSIAVDTGTYQVKQLLPAKGLQPVCPTENSHDIRFQTYGNTTASVDFANKSSFASYPRLVVNVSSERRRRCFTSKTVVEYCNRGNGAAQNAKVYLQLPPLVELVSADKSFTKDKDNTYVFEVGSVLPNQCVSINITDQVVCNDPTITGLTQCTKAWITPSNDVASLNWDKSDIQLKATCNNGQVRMGLFNKGVGHMADSSQVRVYADAQLIYTGLYKLLSADSLMLQVPANGKTIRMETDQRPGHPSRTQSNITLEACGVNSEGKVSTGFVTQLPVDMNVPGEHIECLPIIDSFDPNDKSVTPKGTTANHFTPTGTALDYTVRFQNTGTDVAYKVVVVDTLSAHLDLATLRIGTVSHPFKLSVSGKENPVLTFIFDNINLPDSNSNEALSHGYIKFSITPKNTIAPATVIENYADIFFDFNPAVRTNKVINTIYDIPVEVSSNVNARVTVCSYNKPAFAGNARSICQQDTARLQASAPQAGNGRWKVLKGDAKIAEILNPHSLVNNLSYGDNVFEWKVMSNTCGTDSSASEVTVHRYSVPATPEIVRKGVDSLFCTEKGERYQWYLESKLLNEDTQQIKAEETGQYQVRVLTDKCYSDFSLVYSYQKVTTGLDQLSTQINVYPNPASGVVFIELPVNAKAKILLIDALGRKLKSTSFTGSGHKQELDLTGAQAGIYQLRIEIGSRIIITKLMVR